MKLIRQFIACIGVTLLCTTVVLASDNAAKKAAKATQHAEPNNSLDLSVPNNMPWALSVPKSANTPPPELLPQLLHSEEQPKDFELGARLITRDWKEVNEEEKDWRSRLEGAEFEFKFRN